MKEGCGKVTERRGQCLCGAVRYTVRDATDSFGACHCSMCQRTSGGVNLTFTVPAGSMDIEGVAAVVTYRSSDWAARSFCGTCGSNLWYRLTLPSEAPHEYHVALGSLDDKSGMSFAEEICIDTRPDVYAFAGERRQKTTTEVIG
jgi:hypothetical protein